MSEKKEEYTPRYYVKPNARNGRFDILDNEPALWSKEEDADLSGFPNADAQGVCGFVDREEADTICSWLNGLNEARSIGYNLHRLFVKLAETDHPYKKEG